MKNDFLQPLPDLRACAPGEVMIQLLPDADPALRFLEVLDPAAGEVLDLSSGEILSLDQGWFLPLARRDEVPELEDLQEAQKGEIYRNFFTGEIVEILSEESDSLEVMRRGDGTSRLIARCCGAHFHRI
ncbi:MAG: hypothetical protein RL095_1600 [Verrucomicrobiota bacterium]|jgi:hypothetical protein